MFRWLVLWLLPSIGFTQAKHDSLMQQLAVTKANADAYAEGSTLIHLGTYYYQKPNVDSARYYYQNALSVISTNNLNDLLGQVLNNLGVLNNESGYPDSAILYYNRALQNYTNIGDSVRTLNTQINLSILYKDQGLYQEALNMAFAAALELEKIPPDRSLSSCYNTIALVYARLKNFDQSLLFHNKALTIRQSINYSRGVAQSLNNMAILFKDNHQYDSALSYYIQSLQIKQQAKDLAGAASTLHNIGDVYLELNKLQEAENYFTESLKLKREVADPSGEARTLNSLGKLYTIQQRYPQAKSSLTEAETIATNLKQLDQLRDNYEYQAQLFHELNQDTKAYNYITKLLVVKDSLMNIEKLNQLTQLRVKYAEEAAQNQITLLKQERDLQLAELKLRNTWILGLGVGVLLLAVIGTLAFRQYKLEQKNANRIQVLMKEMQHRMKNNLQVLSSIFTLQASMAPDNETQAAMKDTEGRVNAMALIHKKLYTIDPSRKIEIKSYFEELINYLIHSYGFTQKLKESKILIDQAEIDIDKVIPLGLIINEVVSNALKYAYHNQPQPILNVVIKVNGNELQIEIADNGDGFNQAEVVNKKSFGLKLVNSFVRELNGSIEYNNQNGTQCSITVPLT